MEKSVGFFQQGREYESRYVNHRYLDSEKKLLDKFESVDYFTPHSKVYKDWVAKQPARYEWDRWVTMGLIGFSVGLTAFLMHQGISLFDGWMKDIVNPYLEEGHILEGWVIMLAISCLMVLVSSAIVVFVCPPAGSSGLPELIAYLNGTNVQHIFSLKTFVIKFFSCILAVASGLPVGPEGPMIALGGLIGAGISQFKSTALRIDILLFARLRNSEDRRNFLTAGAGAGVSAAFGAPVGGLLFAMEEVSSFWSDKLGWQTFFCCMVAAFTADIFNSAFKDFHYQGNFGLFQTDNYIIFHVDKFIPLNLLVFIPAIILGFVGGVLGALFTFINLKLLRLRNRVHSALSTSCCLLKGVKILEPILIIIIITTIKSLLPAAFPCETPQCSIDGGSPRCLGHGGDSLHTESSVEHYNCPYNSTGDMIFNGTHYFNGTFSSFATLFYTSGEESIHHLFSRQTHFELSPLSLGISLIFYYPLACWSAGTSVASGLVVPMLMIGGLYGRLIGYAAVEIFGLKTTPFWAWLDPGAFALIGAASFFGGVSRLTMSLTVILMEMTNDIQFLLPLMVTIMVSKWVGDSITHPFYHALLEMKCIPFLDSEPFITHNSKPIALELFRACDCMTSPVKIITEEETTKSLSELLSTNTHSGFPVVNKDNQLVGFITRHDLMIIMEAYQDHCVDSLKYETFLQEENTLRQSNIIEQFRCEDSEEILHTVDLKPFYNNSTVSVQESFSLHRTYVLFRTLGLRHLTVVNYHNMVVGIITRKDLMGHPLEDKLQPLLIDMSVRDVLNNPSFSE